MLGVLNKKAETNKDNQCSQHIDAEPDCEHANIMTTLTTGMIAFATAATFATTNTMAMLAGVAVRPDLLGGAELS